MRVLLVSDVEENALWANYRPGRLDSIDMILSAGDLKPEYLTFLVTMANVPLLYVRGNHDGRYDKKPPEGCLNVDGRLAEVNGLRILGLGGSARYSGGPDQYTQRQMRRRVARLGWPMLLKGRPDIILTHAPPAGYGDGPDFAHRGFDCFLPLMDRVKPRYLIHGHVHMIHAPGKDRISYRGDTAIINAYGRYILDIPDP